MSLNFEELDYRQIRLGELSLRRRRLPAVSHRDIYEVKLGDEFLMSSLFTEAEVELSRLGLSDLKPGELDIVIGGLGLGYTAAAALEFPGIKSMMVIEGLAPVIEWHEAGLLPLSARLTADPRCRFIEADFFELAGLDSGFDPAHPGRRFHAILLDIDHSPAQLLNPAHQAFYEYDGLQCFNRHLVPGGIYALWSNEPPGAAFLQRLRSVFARAEQHIITFDNPFQDGESTNTIYIAQVAAS